MQIGFRAPIVRPRYPLSESGNRARFLRTSLTALATVALAVALLPLPPAVSPAGADGDHTETSWSGIAHTLTAKYKAIDVSWTANPHCCGTTGADIHFSDYYYEWKKTSDSTWFNATSSSASASLTGLDANTSYDFRVSVAKNDGSGTYVLGYVGQLSQGLTVSSATTDAADKPDQPTISSVTADATGMTVNWTAPGHNDAAITGYTVQWKAKTGGSYGSTNEKTAGATDTSLSIPYTASGSDSYDAFTDDTEYDFRLSATNSVGDSAWSADVSQTAWETKPIIASAPTVTAGNTELAVSWSAEDTGATVTSSTVQWKTSSQSYDTTRQATVTGAGTSHTITGLTNSTAYTVRVSSTNSHGTGDWSPEGSGTPAAQVPGVPRNVSVSPAHQKLTVTWDAPTDDGGSSVTGYTVQWKSGAQDYESGRTANVTGTTATISGLTNSTTYTVQVAAKNSVGTGSYATEVTGTPASQVPGVPQNVSTTARNTALRVTWDAPASDGGATVSSYTVQWKSGVQSYDSARQATVTSGTSHDITGLTNSTAYTVRVSATNSVGAGSYAAEVTGTPALTAPDPPTGVTAGAAHEKLNVSWTAPSYTGGNSVSSYRVQWKSGVQDFDSTRQHDTSDGTMFRQAATSRKVLRRIRPSGAPEFL